VLNLDEDYSITIKVYQKEYYWCAELIDEKDPVPLIAIDMERKQ
jgi:hypothetical protein